MANACGVALINFPLFLLASKLHAFPIDSSLGQQSSCSVFTTNQELLKQRVDIQTSKLLNRKSSRAHMFKVFDHLRCKIHLDVHNRK